MPTDQERVQSLVREMYVRAESTQWDLSAEDVRTLTRQRIMLPDMKTLSLVAAAVALVVGGFFLFTPASHRNVVATSPTTTSSTAGNTVLVPNVVGLTQSNAERSIADVGLKTGIIGGQASAVIRGGRVIASDPSAGATVRRGSTVSLTVSSGPPSAGETLATTVPSVTTTTSHPPASIPAPSSTMTTPPMQSNCDSGNASFTMTGTVGSTCITLGTLLTVTYGKPLSWSGYGSWSSSPPTLSDNAVLAGVGYSPSPNHATATFRAIGIGTSTITADFSMACAPSDTTACTVPPAGFSTLTVTVSPK
jgi:hypothetical protein